MSHYLAIVVVPEHDGDVEAAVEKILAPYSEEIAEGGFWDWWQIGGRWTGEWSDYDPADDPANIEDCNLCDSTGKRDDKLGRDFRAANPEYTCNGCDGKGRRLKWPTQWAKHPGDMLPVSLVLRSERFPYTVVTPAGAFHKETWTGKDFVQDPAWGHTVLRALDPYRDALAVVVDYHC